MKNRPIQKEKEIKLPGHAKDIDLSRLHGVRLEKEFFDKFLGDQLPSVFECSDAAESARVMANSLLTCMADSVEANSDATTPTEGWVAEAIKIEVEKLYVVTQRLMEICDRRS